MKSLFFSRDIVVDGAYIITVKGNAMSETAASRCAQSCQQVGMEHTVWDAFDGTGDVVKRPRPERSITDLVKITDHYLTRGEVACALSHISLWEHCCFIDKPIVILEHDAIMLQKFEQHQSLNTIVYLGGQEWHTQKWPMYPIPPHASEGPNYLFMCRAHAYSIDPLVAKNLLAHVLKMGIHAPLDIMMRADLFNITHQGLYAYDAMINTPQDTTIKARPLSGRTTDRNDDLMW